MTIVAATATPLVHYRDHTACPRLVGTDETSAR